MIRPTTFCLTLVIAASAAFAQDYNQVAPKTPQPAATTVSPPAEAKPVVPAAENKQLLPNLKGLRFVDSATRIRRNGVDTTGIEVDPSLALLNDRTVVGQLSAFIGKPLYANDLPKISQIVLEWYRSNDLPVVDVAFPEQDITGGTVQVVVTVYRLGKINVSGNRYFSSVVLRGEMQLRPGEPIAFDVLKEDLNRLNRNPFREVNVVLERSTTPGATDLSLRVDDRRPLRVYASVDNNGLPVTNRQRYSVGLNWGNVFWLDQQLSYQFITSPDLWQSRNRGAGHSSDPRFMAHSLSYMVPLPRGDFLSIFGTYVEQVPDLGPNFDQVGHSLQLSARYQMPLPPLWHVSHQIQIGFDYKRSDNNLQFGGTQIFGSATNVEQFLLDYGLTVPDAWGQTALDNQLYWSPGGWSHGNTTAVYVASGVSGAKASYFYDSLQLTRVFYLPWQMSSVIRLNAQVSTAELLPSEQLGAGGPDSVRGYDPRSANGTQGLLASVELRSPTLSPLKSIGVPVDDSAQGLVFFDSAFLSNKHVQTGQPRNATLESVGFGARYGVGRYLEARFDYGWQIQKAQGASKLGGLANVSVTLSY